MKTKYYTIGEIFRLGLLKGFDGKPYKHQATVSKIVRMLKFKTVMTKWGPAKVVSAKTIEKYNEH